MSKHNWPPGSELTLETIRALHTPEGHCRISHGSYPAGAAFPGITRAGRVYVLSGACRYTFDGTTIDLTAASYFDHSAGRYQFATVGHCDVSVVRVWLLPPEVRRA